MLVGCRTETVSVFRKFGSLELKAIIYAFSQHNTTCYTSSMWGRFQHESGTDDGQPRPHY